MTSILFPILSIALIGLIVLRIFVFRPHKVANLITCILMAAIIFQLGGHTMRPEAYLEAYLGVFVGVVIMVFVFHFLAKKYDKHKEKKRAAKAQSPQNATPPIQPAAAPTAAAAKKVADVPQTLRFCVRCSHPLQGPKCSRCHFDHTAEPVFLLCPVDPHKLQIHMPQPENKK